MEANLHALRSSDSQKPALGKFGELGRLLTGNPEAEASDGVRWIMALVAALQIPGLHKYGLTTDDLDLIAERSLNASSMKANPVVFDRVSLTAILAKAM
jgi:alcohol dehydrogenase